MQRIQPVVGVSVTSAHSAPPAIAQSPLITLPTTTPPEKQQGRQKHRGTAQVSSGAVSTVPDWVPPATPPALRIVFDIHPTHGLLRPTTSSDATVYPCAFAQADDGSLYERLVSEAAAIPNDGHLPFLGDGPTDWKQQAPTLMYVIERLQRYFSNETHSFKVHGARLNRFGEENSHPHDVDAGKRRETSGQFLAVAVCFGATREAIFEEVTTGKTSSFPVQNGSICVCAPTIRINWKQPPEAPCVNIVAWGSIDSTSAARDCDDAA